MNIIVVDDEPKIRNGISKILSKKKEYQICGVFEDAKSALNYLQLECADVIITDIRMPNITGLELIQQIRKTNSDIEIIILSGYSDFSYAQKAIEYGVFIYLTKPTDIVKLFEALEKIREKLKGSKIEDNYEFSNQIVNQAVDYINKNYKERITLELLSKELFISPNYICGLFKEVTGVNLSKFITNVRIEKAKEYLHIVHYNVSDIANMVGYSDAKYFSNVFKQSCGVTPSEYRNNLKKYNKI